MLLILLNGGRLRYMRTMNATRKPTWQPPQKFSKPMRAVPLTPQVLSAAAIERHITVHLNEKTRKSCFLLQNRLPLLYCSTITENWFNCTAVSTKLLLLLWSFYLHQCFCCIAVPMKFLLLLWSFYCFNNVPTALQFILQSDCQYDELRVNGMWEFI